MHVTACNSTALTRSPGQSTCSWQQAGDVTDLQPECAWAMHALALLDIRAWSGNAFGPAATPVYHGSFACPWLAQMSLADCCHAAHLQNQLVQLHCRYQAAGVTLH